MNLRRDITITVQVTKGELVELLRRHHPQCIEVQALPKVGAGTTMEADSHTITLKFVKEGTER